MSDSCMVHKANQLARRYSHESAAKIRNKSEINKHYSNYLKKHPVSHDRG